MGQEFKASEQVPSGQYEIAWGFVGAAGPCNIREIRRGRPGIRGSPDPRVSRPAHFVLRRIAQPAPCAPSRLSK